MNTAFFLLSKYLWLFLSPESLLIGLSILGLVFMAAKAYKKAALTYFFVTACMVLMALLPIGNWLYYPLEKRFPIMDEIGAPVDGIIVLGGAEEIMASVAWNQAEVGAGAERFFAFLRLAKQFPGAKLVYSGGTGDPSNQAHKGAEVAKRLFFEQGLDVSKILFESESRNTFENVLLTQKLVAPKPSEKWVLVTSAAHMPRSFGIFQKLGWMVVPFPVDHLTYPPGLYQPTWNFSGNFKTLNDVLREWTGLVIYFLTGKTARLFPGPENPVFQK